MFDRNKRLYRQAVRDIQGSTGESSIIGNLGYALRRCPPERWDRCRRSDGSIKHVFIGVVSPTPEAALRSLAEKNQSFTGGGVVRPMVSTTNN